MIDLFYPAVLPDEMAKIDEIAIKDYNISAEFLMENAGKALADETLKEKGDNIVCFIGKGNNGGDGLVCARYLLQNKKKVIVVLLSSEENLSSLSQKMWKKLKNNFRFECYVGEVEFEEFLKTDKKPNIIIDALLGTGLRGEVRGIYKKAIDYINSSDALIISADIPSGLNAENGSPLGISVKADKTITFGLPKRGFFSYPGPNYTGKVIVKDIGFPKDLLEKYAGDIFFVREKSVKQFLPKRPNIIHKGEVGRVAIIGGSYGMEGSIILSAKAAFRSGAGYVYILCPKGVAKEISLAVLESVVIPLAETPEGTISQLAYEKIMNNIDKCSSILIGPGMGRNKELSVLMKKIFDRSNYETLRSKNIIIDADGIYNLKDSGVNLHDIDLPIVFTPHAGEASYLMEKDVNYINMHRYEVALDFWKTFKKILVLKGAYTIISNDYKLYINPTGNSGMATAGCGDVLSGMLAAFSAQKKNIFEATILSVYLHGLAGDIGAEKFSKLSIISGDLVNFIPFAIKKIKDL